MQGFAAFSPWQLFGSRSDLCFGGKIRAGGRPFCSLGRQLEEMGALASLRVLSRRQGLISIQLLPKGDKRVSRPKPVRLDAHQQLILSRWGRNISLR